MMAGENTGAQETAQEAGDTVTVRRTVAHPLKNVWNVLMEPHGARALLGEGGRLGSKGESWRAVDGSYGVTRSFHPLEQIRFSWHAEEDAPATLVDLHMRPLDDNTTELEIVHDNLPADADRERLIQHWSQALTSIAENAL